MPYDPGTPYVEKEKVFAAVLHDKFDRMTAYSTDIPIADLAAGTPGSITIAAGGGVSTPYQVAAASGDLALSTSALDVTGATITVAAGGTYKATAVFDFQADSSGVSAPSTCLAIGTLVVNGVTQNGSAQCEAKTASVGTANTVRATVSQFWVITPSTSQVVKLQAKRTDTGSTGAGTAYATHTHLMIERLA